MAAPQPTLLDEIAKFLNCTNEQVRFRLNCPETRARVVAHFQQRLLITNYRDRNGEHRSLIFDGLTRSGADKLPAHGELRYPFNSKLPQYFYDRHNIRLKYPYHPVAIYSNHAHQNHEFYPLELVRLLQKLPDPPRVDEQQQHREEHIYATPYEHIIKQQRPAAAADSRSASSMSTSTSSYQASLARSIADAEERQQQQKGPPLDLILGQPQQHQDEGEAEKEMQYIDRPPSSNARHFVHWTRLRNGRWCAKKVWIKEYANTISFEAEIAKISTSSH